MPKLFDILKNIVLILILIQLAPPFFTVLKKQYNALLEQRTKVGVLCINDCFYNSQSSVQDLRALFKDKDIQAIVLRMECPGGYPGAAQAFYNELRALKQEYTKLVGVYIENLCTSAGYYLACPADFIVATPSAFVGSIGVYIQQPQLKEFINQYKINYSVTKTGTYKTTGDMFLEPTEQGNKMLQGLTDNTYHQFINDVVKARPTLTLETAAVWADGKVFTGSQALEVGLIDAVGSQSTLEALLRKKAPIDGEIEWVYRKKNLGFVKNLFSDDEDTPDSGSFAYNFIKQLANCITSRYSLPG